MSVDYTVRRFTDAEIEPGSLDYGSGEHETVPVAVLRGRVAAVDRALAPLVWLTWLLDIDTTEACEDVYHDGSRVALVGFPSTDDLAGWLSFAVPEDGVPGGLWDRATGSNLAPASEPWEYDLWPKVSGGEVRMPVGVVLPVSDVPALVENLAAALGGDHSPA